ncbi:MAG: hypothetical protein LUG93_11235 [Lachnospiraceae bacterium]|nr:hypothetical protein [Lachnospiraceae bacterium]
MNVQINDCTIRDGGYLLDKNSPEEFVRGVVNGLLTSGIEIIEIGFLQDISNNESIVFGDSLGARKYVPAGCASRFTGFCDNSRYSLEKLDRCDGKAFEYLRISFAKHEEEEALKFIAGAKEKGYKVFANPMDAPSYSAEERSKMISRVNDIKPYAFSIVDTFGVMYLDDLRNIFSQVNMELDPAIRIGLHSHNNLQLSNALAESVIEMAARADRDIAVDGSLYGMGRGAGNASTEVIADYMNKKYGTHYDLGEIFDTIENYIIPCMNSCSWGYNLPVFICGTEGSHVDNISYLRRTGAFSSREIQGILSGLAPEKRRRYGKGYSKTDFSALESACRRYMSEGGRG